MKVCSFVTPWVPGPALTMNKFVDLAVENGLRGSCSFAGLVCELVLHALPHRHICSRKNLINTSGSYRLDNYDYDDGVDKPSMSKMLTNLERT
jgi:hypothetical protein